jgi:hypothetical protein
MREEPTKGLPRRFAGTKSGSSGSVEFEATLDRARSQLEELALVTAELEASLPVRVAEAVREGVRSEAGPVGRQLAEVRGLTAQTIRRLERIESSLAEERYARVDDLGLLVDLVSTGWRNVDERLARIERTLGMAGSGVHPVAEAS